jgi:thioredoxin-related protein
MIGLLAVVSLISIFGSAAALAQPAPVPDGQPVVWPSFENAVEAAKNSERIVLLDVYSPTCPWCRKIQKEIYTDMELQTYIYETFELGRIDISINTDTISFKEYELTSAQLGAGFGATGTPTTIFLDSNGDYITRLPGYHELDEFFDVLKFIGSQSFKEMSFDDYLKAKK